MSDFLKIVSPNNEENKNQEIIDKINELSVNQYLLFYTSPDIDHFKWCAANMSDAEKVYVCESLKFELLYDDKENK